jgi:hypothetical protein
VGRVVRALTGAGFVVAFAVVCAALVTGEPFHHPAWVLVPGRSRRQASFSLALVFLAEVVDLLGSSPQRFAAGVFMAF